MKRAFYVFCFTVLGVLLQFIVHALIETGVIALLVIHHALTVVLFLAGAWWGYASGVKYWNIIYVEKRFGWPPRWKRWKKG